MNEVDAINIKLSRAANIHQVIECCKDWRDIIVRKALSERKLREYQLPLSNKMIEYVITKGVLGNEIASLWCRQCIDGEAITVDDDGKVGFMKQVGYHTGKKEVYEVTTTSGMKIRCTLDHRFETRSGWYKLKDILDDLRDEYWQPKSKYALKMYRLPPGRDDICINKIKLLAFLMQDGSINKKQSLKFTNTNSVLLDEFERCVKSEFDINIKKYPVEETGAWNYLCTTDSHATGSNPMRNWVFGLEWFEGVPQLLFNIRNILLGEFFNIVLACDGTLYMNKKGTCLVTIADKYNKLRVYQALLTKFGVYSTVKDMSDFGDYSLLKIYGNENIKRLFIYTGPILGKEDKYLKMKRVVCEQRVHKNYDFQNVKDVKYIGLRETYDRTIPVKHKYYADGFTVHNSGKTETVSITTLALGTFYIVFLVDNFAAGLFAPVETMVTHVTRNRLRKQFKKVRRWLKKHGVEMTAGEGVTSSSMILESKKTDKEFSCRSLSLGERAEIIGETFNLLIIEQSELVNAMKLKNDVIPMGAASGGVRVMTGTTSPYFKNQYFKDAIIKWSDDPTKNHSTADWIDLVVWELAAKSSVTYKRYVEREKSRMGDDSIEFRTQFGLEWAETATKFMGWEQLVSQEIDYIWNVERLRFFAIDVARAGDSTVVTIIEIDGTEIHIIAWMELQGLDFENQIPKIVKFMKEYAPLRYGLVDVVGLGVTMYDMLKKRLWDEVEKEDGTTERVAWARVGGYYGSVKENDIMYKGMDREFQHGRVYFAKHTNYKREKSRFIDQILDIERHYTGHVLKLEAPKVKGRHDDYPISLAMSIHAFREKSFNTGVRYSNY